MPDPFARQAKAYAAYRPTYPDELYAFIFHHLERKRYAWDCGTGSGQVAAYLSDHFDKVYATDKSNPQLEHALRKDNVKYSLGFVEQTQFPSDYFDLITAAQAVHWFDFSRFFNEVRRTARDGGLLAVFGYGRVQVHPIIDPFVEQLYDETFGKYYCENRKHVDEAYRTIPFPFDEILSPSFEIKTTWTLSALEGYFNSWSSVQKIRAEEGYNPVDTTMREIKREVQGKERLVVSFPVFLRLGRIHKKPSL